MSRDRGADSGRNIDSVLFPFRERRYVVESPREARKTGTSLGFAVERFQRTKNAEFLSRDADNIDIRPDRWCRGTTRHLTT